jgi:hypothetical protein
VLKTFARFIQDMAEREIDELQIRQDAAEVLGRQRCENVVL